VSFIYLSFIFSLFSEIPAFDWLSLSFYWIVDILYFIVYFIFLLLCMYICTHTHIYICIYIYIHTYTCWQIAFLFLWFVLHMLMYIQGESSLYFYRINRSFLIDSAFVLCSIKLYLFKCHKDFFLSFLSFPPKVDIFSFFWKVWNRGCFQCPFFLCISDWPRIILWKDHIFYTALLFHICQKNTTVCTQLLKPVRNREDFSWRTVLEKSLWDLISTNGWAW
jgi:hypothetical protein